MKKAQRQELIQEIIQKEPLRTQKEIQQRLKEKGVVVTQTTLSRDLREIGLTKVKENDQFFYVVAQKPSPLDLLEYLCHHTRSVARAAFILVFQTQLGEAAILANTVDERREERILGTIAGANTLLIICRDEQAALEIEHEFRFKERSLTDSRYKERKQ